MTAWHYRGVGRPFFFDCRKAEAELGWEPRVSTNEMLRQTYDWYLEHRNADARAVGGTQTDAAMPRVLALLKAIS